MFVMSGNCGRPTAETLCARLHTVVHASLIVGTRQFCTCYCYDSCWRCRFATLFRLWIFARYDDWFVATM